ncbi:zinc-binding dehydrogenase [Streptomyces sp. Je 1-4]|uniref:quinone oxidoreductase family protein n=1 Tax=Streptomyces TaxID=1883 RepID=UPI0021DAD7C4|nr:MULTISPECIES: zinc-binding dehydrogenase [unclassified Streptomyces]UYB38924.1 zinc-binding dehydrogenase [Streptomyces sp. Je 1-4]UZQ34918.1 zinc-binding dehydrogenase [Streptomyces sp. Je 1-4] [Streptomyces sp. Je 1-4 4N24]UZQ42336.1 zinc-binding dehydrogenase [Streptomyces sp. Je 1-4] [Streptomyces sp. Je 1-4 4N24_ara]
MRRVRFHSYGGPDVLRVEETAEEPAPGPGELLVRTEAIGVTLPCVRRVRGDGNGGGDPLPSMPGGEIAGTVVALGPDVTGFALGDRVTSLTFTGSYTELALAPTFLASRIPDGASAVEAVALVRSGHVALAALSTAAPRGTESLLITGAAGATGHLAVQLAKLQGVPRVVAAVSSAAKAEFLRGLGADEVVTYDQESWGAPADIVLDGVGGELLPRALAALAPGGRLIFFNSGGGTVPAYELLAGDKTVTGLTMRHFSTVHRELYEEHRAQLWELAGSGRLRAAVHAELPLDEAAKAHEIIEGRANLGKVVLRP